MLNGIELQPKPKQATKTKLGKYKEMCWKPTYAFQVLDLSLEVSRARFFRVWVGLGLHTLGSGFFGLEKFTN
jgi:hypothetical protein